MREIYEKMREHLERYENSKVRGLSTRDVVDQNYAESDFLELVDGLKQRPIPGEISFRLSSFIFEKQSERIPEEIRRKAADNIADCVSVMGADVDAAVAEIFIFWGTHRKDYGAACSRLLDHTDPSVRSVAVSCAGFFLHRKDFDQLLKFRRDQYISEIAMCGPLRFILRDHALKVLKSLTNCDISEDDCFEETPDGRVFYRSWSSFLQWFEKHKVG
jgi:hypothetical protein